MRLGLGCGLTSQGGASGPTIGPELLTNGGFNVDANWTKGTNETIAGGVLNCNEPGAGDLASQSIAFVAGATYRVTFTIASFTSGQMSVGFTIGANTFGTNRSATGTYTQDIVAGSGNSLFKLVSGSFGFVGTIDNVSLRKIG